MRVAETVHLRATDYVSPVRVAETVHPRVTDYVSPVRVAETVHPRVTNNRAPVWMAGCRLKCRVWLTKKTAPPPTKIYLQQDASHVCVVMV